MSSWDETNDAPDDVRAMLAHAKRSQSMTAADQARNAARVAKIAAQPVVGPGLGPIAKGALWGVGVGLAALAMAALVVPRVVTRRVANAASQASASERRNHAPTPVVPIERPVEVAPSPEATHETALTAPAEARPVIIATPPSTRARTIARPAESVGTHPDRAEASIPSHGGASGAFGSNTADALTREAALLGRAQATLASDPAAALEQLGEHLREFPHGQFAADREFLAVDALLRLGRREEARRRADALATDHPRSVYVARVRRMIGSAE
jgi:hypothetical protein